MSNTGYFEHGGNLYAAARLEERKIEEMLDFSANINPLGMPDSVHQALVEALPHIIHYPDPEAAALKDAISRRFGVEKEKITAGNGAAELLYVLCHMFRPQRVLVPAPTFSEYERAARACGAAVDYLYLSPADNFAISTEKIAQRLPKVDILFLCNPNNPTGQVLPRDRMEEIIALAEKMRVVVVVDESFLEFLPEEGALSCRPLLPRYANLVILQSLTKFYALPGLRLGFALADRAICAMLDKGKDPWNVNSLAQAAGTIALADAAYRAKGVITVSAAREAFLARLSDIPGIIPLAGSANFILADIAGTGFTSGQLCQCLAQKGILIRDCSNYPGLSEAYVRLAVKMPQQNEVLAACLQKITEGSDRS
ncbi:MAG: threonine-phosphate decarboxylase CobD [Negativicutes bacterium]|nr:threonine-phosphate decarboxylase CobD [Negativicutes bacterium]